MCVGVRQLDARPMGWPHSQGAGRPSGRRARALPSRSCLASGDMALLLLPPGALGTSRGSGVPSSCKSSHGFIRGAVHVCSPFSTLTSSCNPDVRFCIFKNNTMKTCFESLFFWIIKTQGEGARGNLCNKHLSVYTYLCRHLCVCGVLEFPLDR